MLDSLPATCAARPYTKVAARGYVRPYQFAKRVDTALVVGARHRQLTSAILLGARREAH
jgi:hypothetical protein